MIYIYHTYIYVHIYVHTQGNENLVISHIGKNVKNSHALLGKMYEHLAALENRLDVSYKDENANAKYSFLLEKEGREGERD